MSPFAKLSSYQLYVFCLCLSFASVSAYILNQTRPAAGEIIKVEEPYTIIWTPDTLGDVTIVLMANSNWQVQAISSSTKNNGSYSWTPEASLASDNNGSNYFLQICDVITNQCSYTNDGRFGFTNLQATSASSGSSTAAASSAQSTSLSTQSTSTSSSTTNSSPPASSTSASSSAATTSSTSSGDLSTTAKIAIGVILSIVGTAALLVGAFMLLRRHKRFGPTPVYGNYVYEKQPAKAELHNSSSNPSELPSTTPNAVPAQLHELDTHTSQS